MYSESMVPLRKSPRYRMAMASRAAATMDSAIFLVMRAAAMRNVSGKSVKKMSNIKSPPGWVILGYVYYYNDFTLRLQYFKME